VLSDLGRPILVGVSRKHFLGPDIAARDRLAGSLAAGLESLNRGARILRVHDVIQTVQAIRVWQALQN
jgi:dihydropteroate synthase